MPQNVSKCNVDGAGVYPVCCGDYQSNGASDTGFQKLDFCYFTTNYDGRPIDFNEQTASDD